jgi:hypothetical protein
MNTSIIVSPGGFVMPSNLTELFEQMCSGHVAEWDDLPHFANKDASHDFGVWSWDEHNAIVGESRDVLSIRPYSLRDGHIVVDWEAKPVAEYNRLI